MAWFYRRGWGPAWPAQHRDRRGLGENLLRPAETISAISTGETELDSVMSDGGKDKPDRWVLPRSRSACARPSGCEAGPHGPPVGHGDQGAEPVGRLAGW
jgi:hypothetical protein